MNEMSKEKEKKIILHVHKCYISIQWYIHISYHSVPAKRESGVCNNSDLLHLAPTVYLINYYVVSHTFSALYGSVK